MKKFANDLADFLQRHYPQAHSDGWYRFSADIQIRAGNVDVEIPVLTRLPDIETQERHGTTKADPLKIHMPKDGAP
jgi:hypothetical protein